MSKLIIVSLLFLVLFSCVPKKSVDDESSVTTGQCKNVVVEVKFLEVKKDFIRGLVMRWPDPLGGPDIPPKEKAGNKAIDNKLLSAISLEMMSKFEGNTTVLTTHQIKTMTNSTAVTQGSIPGNGITISFILNELSDGNIEFNPISCKIEGMPEIKANVVLNNGESIVLCEFDYKSLRELNDVAPFIGKAPVLGALFKSKSFKRGESVGWIVVTPKVVEVRNELQKSLQKNDVYEKSDGISTRKPIEKAPNSIFTPSIEAVRNEEIIKPVIINISDESQLLIRIKAYGTGEYKIKDENICEVIKTPTSSGDPFLIRVKSVGKTQFIIYNDDGSELIYPIVVTSDLVLGLEKKLKKWLKTQDENPMDAKHKVLTVEPVPPEGDEAIVSGEIDFVDDLSAIKRILKNKAYMRNVTDLTIPSAELINGVCERINEYLRKVTKNVIATNENNERIVLEGETTQDVINNVLEVTKKVTLEVIPYINRMRGPGWILIDEKELILEIRVVEVKKDLASVIGVRLPEKIGDMHIVPEDINARHNKTFTILSAIGIKKLDSEGNLLTKNLLRGITNQSETQKGGVPGNDIEITYIINEIAGGKLKFDPITCKINDAFELKEQFTLEIGQSIVVCEFDYESLTKMNAAVPFLGKVPVLAILFKSKSFKRGESVGWIVVTPIIMDEESECEKVKKKIDELKQQKTN